ncbi:hypothetical protein EVAR_11171_1 [Eumeta japonica]|uniref:Uncharacterized protein n=1 Tax=Eumeta variegata TaxID=151549 RepID=A0A4C1U4G9_EUMVA|nr:hypothetical protein EVAR_11171_1 [Eumeta japonica]
MTQLRAAHRRRRGAGAACSQGSSDIASPTLSRRHRRPRLKLAPRLDVVKRFSRISFDDTSSEHYCYGPFRNDSEVL